MQNVCFFNTNNAIVQNIVHNYVT